MPLCPVMLVLLLFCIVGYIAVSCNVGSIAISCSVGTIAVTCNVDANVDNVVCLVMLVLLCVL